MKFVYGESMNTGPHSKRLALRLGCLVSRFPVVANIAERLNIRGIKPGPTKFDGYDMVKHSGKGCNTSCSTMTAVRLLSKSPLSKASVLLAVALGSVNLVSVAIIGVIRVRSHLGRRSG